MAYTEPVIRDGAWGYMVLGTFVDERRILHSKRPWRPFRETVPTRDGRPDPRVLDGGETFWANSHYLVFKALYPSDDGGSFVTHLSMRTVENDARHDWREMQRVKNELCDPEWEAIELYPAESRVVDTANQFHLWCFPEPIGLGFVNGEKTPHSIIAKMPGSGRQRDFTT